MEIWNLETKVLNYYVKIISFFWSSYQLVLILLKKEIVKLEMKD